MEWRVLGPLEVLADGSPVSLGGRQRRLVLAILLSNAHQSVTTDKVIDGVWGDSPPDSARKTIQAHVAHLRKALNGKSEYLSSTVDGYVITPDAGSVDSDNFEAAVAAAQESRFGEPARTAALLDDALAMFRGEPYAGLGEDALAIRVEVARLAELRLSAREDRLDALLAAGDAPRAAAEAERLLAAHPLRERLWATEMLALYRSGRQSEALQSFSRARQVLAHELGIEPSNELRALELQILEQDASLASSTLPAIQTSPVADLRRNPYKGLRAFDEADSNDFFGRAELVRQLVDRFASRTPAPLTVLAGPSGAGKSSVLRAGLIPRLRDQGLIVAVMFPGNDPEEALERACREETTDGATDNASDPVDVIAVDQFEELFTETSGDKRDRFIARMIDETDSTRWVVTVRADFLDELLTHPELGRRLQESLALVSPLEDGEVEAAVVEPARLVGVEVEPSLVATIVREIRSRPSALPLLQYALTDVFERRRRDELTLDSYERRGGLSGALVRRADQVFERLSAHEREATRRIFLQLVTIADNGEFARRRVHRDSLDAIALHAMESGLADRITEQFGAQRLLSFDQDPKSGHATVELAHESILDAWPRLARWIEEAREDLLMRSALNTALVEWEASDREESFLLNGGRLAQHESWTVDTDVPLSANQVDFLATSRRSADLALARRRRQRNLIMAGFGFAAAVATVFGVLALQRASEANQTARAAQSAGLATTANGQLEIDPELSVLLAIEAVETTRRADGTVLPVAREALHRAVLADRLIGRSAHFSDPIAAFAPDGRTFVTSSESTAIAQIWSVDPFEWKLDLQGHTDRVFGAAYDRAGERIATSSFDRSVRIWDATTGQSQMVLAMGGIAINPVFSNDGTKMAVTIGDTKVSMWDLATGDQIWSSSTLPGPDVAQPSLDFSPDDSLLAVTLGSEEADEAISPIFDAIDGTQVGTLAGQDLGLTNVGFTPDGSRVLTSSVDGTVKIWDSETQELQATFRGHGGPVLDFAISEDGHTVASSGVGVLVWDLATLEVKAELFGHSGSVDEIDISPDGRLLLTSSSSDRTTRLWDLTPFWAHELIGLPGPDALPGAVAFSPGGDQLAASRGSNQVTLWSPLNGTELQTLDDTGTVSSLAFSAAGDLLASAGESGTVIHDLLSGERLLLHTGPATEIVFGPGDVLAVDTPDGIRLWEPPVSGEGQRVIPTPFSSTVAFAPNGEMLAIGGPLGVEIYQVDGIHIRNLYGPPPSPPPPNVLALSFDPTGSLLVSAGDDFSAVLWSTETFQPLHHLEGHTGVVLDAVFDPTRPQVATADDHGTVKLWNAETGALRVSISVPGGISDLSYSPDGKYLAAISEQGFVTVLILEIDELVAEAKEGLTRWWTETECRQHLASEVCPPAPDHLTD